VKAVVYNGPYSVAVDDVADARIEHPNDAVIRITTTNICGSDLHMYEGRTNVEKGKVLGHENMGIVEEVGNAVAFVKVGDRVSVPFNVACGTCQNCQSGWTSFCTRMNPNEGMDGAAYGYANMGPYNGGQADYLRVPFADFNLLELPEGNDFENDFTMLSDIFPTAYHGCEMADIGPGHTVAVFGAGPVGLLAAHSALPHDASGEEHPELVLDNLVKVVRSTGAIGVMGVYMPADPGAATEGAKKGRIDYDYGTFFTKGQRMGTGQAPVKRYNRELRDMIIAGRAKPSLLVSHDLGLADAAGAYDKFDKREDGWTKVLLHPAA